MEKSLEASEMTRDRLVAGKDYAVNGAASSRYPPVQQIWNSATYPNVDIDRLTVKGLTLCDWSATPPKHHYLLKR